MSGTTQSPTMYHGTRMSFAEKIVSGGFRRASRATYTGTGVNASELMSTAYEYGSYETGGAVLAFDLAPGSVWEDSGLGGPPGGFDRYFRRTGIDALCCFGGNVWVVWNTAMIRNVRILSAEQAIRQLCQEFDEEGADVCYNGCVQDYADIWWGRQEAHSGDHWAQQFKRNLIAATGRATSSLAHACA